MKYFLAIIVIALIVGGGWFYLQTSSANSAATEPTPSVTQNTSQPSALANQPPQPVPAAQVDAQPTTAAPARVKIAIANFAFSPATITLHKGDTITWTNNDSAPHTVTSDTGAFASDNLSQGQSYSHTFDKAGTFSYHCAVHPHMKAMVIVQ